MGLQIEMPADEIKTFCKRYAIRRLSVFGSALRNDFSSESDIDVLVEFEPGRSPGLIGLAGMEFHLSRILGLQAELHTPNGLNPRFRQEVLDQAEVQYESAG
jgi:hypothetical protein